MESKDWSGFGYFSPDFSPGIPVSQRIWTPRGFGLPVQIRQRIWTPPVQIRQRILTPFADLNPPLPKVPFKYRLYHTWSLILFGSFLPMFFSITTQHSSIKVKKNSHFVPILPHLLQRVVQYTQELNANKLLHSNF